MTISTATEHGQEATGKGLPTHGLLEDERGHLMTFQPQGRHLIIQTREGLDQIGTSDLHAFLLGFRERFHRLGGRRSGLRDKGTLMDHIELTSKFGLAAVGQDDGPGVGTEPLAKLLHHALEAGSSAVHLVDERETGHAVAVGLSPHGFTLGLHATHAAEDGDHAVQHTQGALNLRSEVHMARGVDDVETMTLTRMKRGHTTLRERRPMNGHGSGGNGYSLVAFDVGEVGRRVAIMHLAGRVDRARVKEDAFGQRGLARIDVRGNADVAQFLQRLGLVGGGVDASGLVLGTELIVETGTHN